jgi:hypothetical protein
MVKVATAKLINVPLVIIIVVFQIPRVARRRKRQESIVLARRLEPLNDKLGVFLAYVQSVEGQDQVARTDGLLEAAFCRNCDEKRQQPPGTKKEAKRRNMEMVSAAVSRHVYAPTDILRTGSTCAP